MQFDDTKKKYEIEFTGIGNINGHSTPLFKLTLFKPVKAESGFDIHDITTENGVTGIKFSQYSNIAKAYKFKGNVLSSMLPEALEYIQKTHEEELNKVKEEAKKDPETWFWAVGGDTHQIYLTPDSETGTEFREDLKKVEEILEKKLRWLNNPLDAVSKKIDRETGLYTETGWFEVPHTDLIRIYNEIVAEKEAKKTEKEDKNKAIFEKAKQTGEKQIIETYSVECSDPDEECDIDIVTVYAMPDGTTKTTQNHTW